MKPMIPVQFSELLCVCVLFFRNTVTGVENFWELEVILCVVRQMYLSEVKRDKKNGYCMYSPMDNNSNRWIQRRMLSILGTLVVTHIQMTSKSG